MVRVLASIVLLLSLAPYAALLDAQFLLAVRKRTPPPAAAAPTVTITIPTSEQTLQTAASSINLGGIATHATGLGIASVTASVNGGAAIPAVVDGVGNWGITASGSSATIAQDTFNPTGTNVDVVSRVSTPSGGAWTEVTDTGTDGFFQLLNGTGTVRPSASDTNDRMIATLAPSTALSGTNYTVAVRIASVATAVGVTQGVVFGAETGLAPNDYCAAVVYEASASPDLYLIKVVAGIVNDLGSANADIGANDTVLVDVSGSTLLVKENGTTAITASSADCDTGSDAGIFCGNVRSAGDDCNSNFSLDDFEAVDRGATTAGVPLSLGANSIVVTVTDTNAVTSTDTLVVTRGASDTTPPTISYQVPTSGATYNAPTTTVNLSGIAEDLGGSVSSVAVACTNATPTNPMVTGTTTWSAATITLTGGVAVCTATATDAATLTTNVVLSITPPDVGDITDPVVTITTNGGAGVGVNFSTTAATQSLVGTCEDAVGCSSMTFTCPQCSGGSMSGVQNWTLANIPLTPNVAHVVTVRGCDLAGNCHEDSITVTRTVADLVISTTTLPNGINGTAYPVTCLASTGGVQPYTYSVVVGSLPGWATLNASTGCITGTPNAEATTNFTVRNTDSQGSPDTDDQALSLTVVASGAETAHSHFNALIARGDCTLAFSLRPVASGSTTRPTDCSNPHFRYQIQEGQSQSVLNSSSGVNNFTIGWEYDVVSDTDPNKQDGAAFTIPAFAPPNWVVPSVVTPTLNTTLPDGTGTTLLVTNPHVLFSLNNSGVKIENEIVQITACTSGAALSTNCLVNGVGSYIVTRGAFGTSAVAHTAGVEIWPPFNSFSGHQLRMRFPLQTSDGNTYVWTWDTFRTDSYFTIGASWPAQKSYVLGHRSGGGGFWWEPRSYWAASAITRIANTCNDATDVMAMSSHAYMSDDGPVDWALSNGSALGPGWGGADEAYIAVPANAEMGAVSPVVHCVPANKWVRNVIRVKQIANDYDRLDQWACTEGAMTCTQLYTNVPVSIPQPYSVPTSGTNELFDFWFRYNTSTDRYRSVIGSDPFKALRGYDRNWSMHTATTVGGTLNDLDAAGFLENPVR